jgi:hypothetical protein
MVMEEMTAVNEIVQTRYNTLKYFVLPCLAIAIIFEIELSASLSVYTDIRVLPYPAWKNIAYFVFVVIVVLYR